MLSFWKHPAIKKLSLIDVSICAGDAFKTVRKEKENDSALLNAAKIGAGHEDDGDAGADKDSSGVSLRNERAEETDRESVEEDDPDSVLIFDQSPAVAGPSKQTPGFSIPKQRRTEDETQQSAANSSKVSCICVC